MLCLLIALTSVHFGKQWSEEAKQADVSVNKTSSEVSSATRVLSSVSSLLTKDDKYLTLDQAVSKVMLDVFNNRVEHGIVIAIAAPAKVAGGGMSKMSSLAEDVPGSSLKSVKVNLSGTYQTYPGLMSYLAELQKNPLAVVHLKVHEQTFEASVRIYGVFK